MKKPATAVKATPKKNPRKAAAPPSVEKVETPLPQSAILIDAEAPSPPEAEPALNPEPPFPDPLAMATIRCAFCGVPYEAAGRLLLTLVEVPDGGHLKLPMCHLCAVTEHARVTHMLAPDERARYLRGAQLIGPAPAAQG